TVFLGKASGTTAPALVWRIEGKTPNTTALTTNNATDLSLLLVCIEWNHDGTLNESNQPLNPDRMFLWVNPDLSSEPSTNTASAISVRTGLTAVQNPYLHFNKVGFRGITCGGVVDEFRLGTTFRSVAPMPVLTSPELSAVRVGGNVQIRWATAAGFVLQQTDSLSTPSWSNVAQTPTTDGGDSVVTLNASGAHKYFRLMKTN
ncbi:MAG: hypothetical protein ACK4UN_20850, partial [Limisphaerales bacterium]